jgi:N-acyl-D-amino-acid deacylase
MAEGAYGLSTGLEYKPGAFAKTEEIVRLARLVKKHQGIYATHLRDEASGVLQSIDEAIEIAKQSGVPLHLSHLKLGGRTVWGRHRDVLEKVGAARRSGLHVTQDVYVYLAAQTHINQLFPVEYRDPQRLRSLERNKRKKAEAIASILSRLRTNGFEDFAHVTLLGSRPGSPPITIPAATKRQFGTDVLDKQIEFLIRTRISRNDLAWYAIIDESDLRGFLSDPFTHVASDAEVASPEKDIHPRATGNAVRLLGKYARTDGLLSLEEAVRRQTNLPAKTFGIERRGQVAKGYFADLVIFDAKEVDGPADYSRPHEAPVGVRHVFVNGVEVIRNGTHTSATPGMVLRKGYPPSSRP